MRLFVLTRDFPAIPGTIYIRAARMPSISQHVVGVRRAPADHCPSAAYLPIRHSHSDTTSFDNRTPRHFRTHQALGILYRGVQVGLERAPNRVPEVHRHVRTNEQKQFPGTLRRILRER